MRIMHKDSEPCRHGETVLLMSKVIVDSESGSREFTSEAEAMLYRDEVNTKIIQELNAGQRTVAAFCGIRRIYETFTNRPL